MLGMLGSGSGSAYLLKPWGTSKVYGISDPDYRGLRFIPNDKRIIHATKLLKKDTIQTLRFIAPKKPGKYPYLCSYPGHWTIMKGEMIVK